MTRSIVIYAVVVTWIRREFRVFDVCSDFHTVWPWFSYSPTYHSFRCVACSCPSNNCLLILQLIAYRNFTFPNSTHAKSHFASCLFCRSSTLHSGMKAVSSAKSQSHRLVSLVHPMLSCMPFTAVLINQSVWVQTWQASLSCHVNADCPEPTVASINKAKSSCCYKSFVFADRPFPV